MLDYFLEFGMLPCLALFLFNLQVLARKLFEYQTKSKREIEDAVSRNSKLRTAGVCDWNLHHASAECIGSQKLTWYFRKADVAWHGSEELTCHKNKCGLV